MADRPQPTYDGDGRYIFVCYAHDDDAPVYADIRWLQDKGINLWYDEGISAGSNWRAEIGDRVERADSILVFISPSAVASDHCNREINYALDQGKTILPVYLETTNLTTDLRIGLNRIQAINRHELSKSEYRSRIFKALSTDENTVDLAPPHTTLKKTKRPGYLVFIGLATMAVIAYWSGLFELRTPNEHVLEQTQVELDTRTPLEIARDRADSGEYYEAYRILRKLAEQDSNNPEILSLLDEMPFPILVETDPPDVQVSLKKFEDAEWISVGTTPATTRVPQGSYVWRFVKDGYQTRDLQLLAAYFTGFVDHGMIRLKPDHELDGMVQVPRLVLENYQSNYVICVQDGLEIPEFQIDRHEVTNEQFKEFVDGGGYLQSEYWEGFDFEERGQRLKFEEALTRFVDTTNRPGPSTWELGTYPVATADHPVTGISWYEATAYARFREKSLPSVYHWISAAMPFTAQGQVLYSNFSHEGTRSVGGSIPGSSGTLDIFGNAREWLLNPTENGDRWIQGGAWDDPPYIAISPYALPPMDRNERNGLRLADYGMEDLFRMPIAQTYTDFDRRTPVGDEAYAVIVEQYKVPDIPLEPVLESTSTDEGWWRREVVSLNSDFEDQRFKVHLFLPPEGEQIYQTVIMFPSTVAFMSKTNSEERLFPEGVEFLPRTGRAVVHPVYWGSYERYFGLYEADSDFRSRVQTDLRKHWQADFMRTIKYLATRSDINVAKLGYYGTSLGASHALVLLALNKTIKVAVLSDGGLGDIGFSPMPTAADPINFLPRISQPALILNGEYDFIFPIASQKLLVELLGTSRDHKKHVLFPAGHGEYQSREYRRLIVEWYDQYLGPVSIDRR